MANVNFGISLTNDREREDFLLDYTNWEAGWYLWTENALVQRKWYRRDFDGWSVVIEEAMHMVRTRIANHEFPPTPVIMHMFLVDDWSLPFESHIAFKKQIMERLRALTANGGTV